MTKRITNSQPAAAPAPHPLLDAIAKLQAEIAALREHARALVARDIELFANGKQFAVKPEYLDQTEENVLAGFMPAGYQRRDTALTPGAELWFIQLAQHRVAEEIRAKQHEIEAMRIPLAAEVVKAATPAFRKNLRATFEVLMALRRLNAERHRIREEMRRAAGIDVFMSGDNFSDILIGDGPDYLADFIDRLVLMDVASHDEVIHVV